MEEMVECNICKWYGNQDDLKYNINECETVEVKKTICPNCGNDMDE